MTRYATAKMLCLSVSLVLLCGCGSLLGSNRPPTIQSVNADNRNDTTADKPLTVMPGSSVLFACNAVDPDIDPLTFQWSAQTGSGTPTTPSGQPQSVAVWTAPTTEGPVIITCTVSDNRGGVNTGSAYILVAQNNLNHPPTVSLAPASVTLTPGQTQEFTATAADPDAGDQANLTYAFFANTPSIAPNPNDKTKAEFTAPTAPGNYTVYCIVTDQHGGSALATAAVTVKTP